MILPALVDDNQSFGGIYYLLDYMEANRPPETFVTTYKTVWRHNERIHNIVFPYVFRAHMFLHGSFKWNFVSCHLMQIKKLSSRLQEFAASGHYPSPDAIITHFIKMCFNIILSSTPFTFSDQKPWSVRLSCIPFPNHLEVLIYQI